MNRESVFKESKESNDGLTFKSFFSEYIGGKYDVYDDHQTRKEIAEILGIPQKARYIQNIINGGDKYYTTNRDLLIAICFAYKMPLEYIDKALILNKMSPLEGSRDGRDVDI